MDIYALSHRDHSASNQHKTSSSGNTQPRPHFRPQWHQTSVLFSDWEINRTDVYSFILQLQNEFCTVVAFITRDQNPASKDMSGIVVRMFIWNRWLFLKFQRSYFLTCGQCATRTWSLVQRILVAKGFRKWQYSLSWKISLRTLGLFASYSLRHVREFRHHKAHMANSTHSYFILYALTLYQMDLALCAPTHLRTEQVSPNNITRHECLKVSGQSQYSR